MAVSVPAVRHFRPPRGVLRDFVELLWLFDGYVQPHARERMLQAHFIHDFRAFSGFTPTAYFALKSEHRNHVPLPD